MEIIILGSGGCVSTPRACCNCRVCTEAREKGFPYARTGCSLFIEDANILIDTPEDINTALNNARIQKVEHILYSHCDPDHTMGMRVIEQLKMDWLAVSVGEKLQESDRGSHTACDSRRSQKTGYEVWLCHCVL